MNGKVYFCQKCAHWVFTSTINTTTTIITFHIITKTDSENILHAKEKLYFPHFIQENMEALHNTLLVTIYIENYLAFINKYFTVPFEPWNMFPELSLFPLTLIDWGNLCPLLFASGIIAYI